MPKDKTRAIAIYSRKSKFTGKGESIENQIELCRQYIVSHYSQETAAAAIVYEDEGFSSGNTDRPQFRQMMSDAREKKISAVVCYRLDRVSRNIGDFSGLIQELERLNISFISIREDFDTCSPMGRAMMYIASVFSQLERETIAERIRDNMHELAKTGRWLGGTTPTGYASESVSNVTVDGKSKKACKLSLIEKEADIVRLIFSKFLETGSLTQTDTFLLQNRITTKNGRDFTRFAIKNILTNPVYMIADEAAYRYLSESGAELFSDRADFDGVCGIMAYNRTEQKHGEAHKIRPEDEWIVAVGKHPGIISGEDWIKVQTYLEQNRSKSFRKTRSNTALLSGILICGSCGDYMRPKLTKRTNKDGELVYTYLCSTKERSHSERCAVSNISGNLLDRIVCTEIKKLSEDSSAFVKSVEKAKKDILSDKGDFSENIEELKKSFSENEKAIENLTKNLADNSESSAVGYIIKEIERLHKKNDGLKSQIDELENIRNRQIIDGKEFDILRDMLSSLAKTVDIMSAEQKRAAIRACVKKIVWDGENVHIYLYGSDDSGNTLEIPLSEYSKSYIDGTSITDENLCELFGQIGYDVRNDNLQDLFFTNYVLCYREEGCSGGFKQRWANNCSQYFVRLVKIIQPKVIICLGRSVYYSVMRAFEKKISSRKYNDIIEKGEQIVCIGDFSVHVFPMAHCGVMGTNNRNKGTNCKGLDLQKKDWEAIKKYS